MEHIICYLTDTRPWDYRMIPELDSRFSVNRSCNPCGICEKTCPIKNILLENRTPLWQHGCQMCFSCINNCQVQTIDYGRKHRRTGRIQKSLNKTFGPIKPEIRKNR